MANSRFFETAKPRFQTSTPRLRDPPKITRIEPKLFDTHVIGGTILYPNIRSNCADSSTFLRGEGYLLTEDLSDAVI